jgi:hypothetical protein
MTWSPKTLPQVIDFLGYDPHPTPRTLAETLRAIRRALGLGQRELAERIGAHPRMILAWKRTAGGRPGWLPGSSTSSWRSVWGSGEHSPRL